ncbi:MAG: flagellar biosynthetic protein FliR [Nitrosomonadales bacterium]|nr:flagellar biosynthetic protein FliR [Nitrosomonadales bacterium]
MISFTSAQLDTLIAAFIYPLTRILAFLVSAPLFGDKQIPARVKVAFGVVLASVLAPVINVPPDIQPASAVGLAVLAEQILIGAAMGLTMRLVFTAVEMSGELAGMQTGLGFASFYDPQHATFTPVLAQFLGLVAMLAFIAMDGHLYLLATLAESFQRVPISVTPPAASGLGTLVLWGGAIFAFALQLSMPIIAALLVTNLALGILTRSAPQLNLFAVGFPITLTVGFGVLMLSMSYMGPLLDHIIHEGLETALRVVTQFGKH